MAAACFGLINSIGHAGGFVGPYVVGYLNEKSGNLSAAFAFIGTCYLLAAAIVTVARIQAPAQIEDPVVFRNPGKVRT